MPVWEQMGCALPPVLLFGQNGPLQSDPCNPNSAEHTLICNLSGNVIKHSALSADPDIGQRFVSLLNLPLPLSDWLSVVSGIIRRFIWWPSGGTFPVSRDRSQDKPCLEGLVTHTPRLVGFSMHCRDSQMCFWDMESRDNVVFIGNI